MTQRVLIGQRGTSRGLWCSKQGYNVQNAAPVNMLFDMSSRSEQILQFGYTQLNTAVGLGYSSAPVVIVNDLGITTGEASLIRPFLNIEYQDLYCFAFVHANYFYIQAGSGNPNVTNPGNFQPGRHAGYMYFVHRRRL